MSCYIFSFSAPGAPLHQQFEDFESPAEAKAYALAALRLMIDEPDGLGSVSIGDAEGAAIVWIGAYSCAPGQPPQWASYEGMAAH
jgi:hypothetical protein